MQKQEISNGVNQQKITQKILVALLVVVLPLLVGLTRFANVYSEQSEIEKSVAYLKSQPQTAWSTMALAANGESGLDLIHLKSVAVEQKSVTTYAKYILALVSVAENPATFGNENYVEALKGYYQGNQFGDTALLNDDVWAILALGSIGQENLSQFQAAKDYILTFQNPDGGWGYATSAGSDTNSTAATVMALLEAGVSSSSAVITNAVNYLKSAQNNDGGFCYDPNSDWGKDSDSASDAWVISAIYKLSQNPTSTEWTKSNKNPIDHLKSLQDEDGGIWWKKEGTTEWNNKNKTADSLIALLGKFYPVNTYFNQHLLRIEGLTGTVCNTQVNGGTAMDLVIAASKTCGYSYSITEYPGMGLYLSALAGENSWMYMVNYASPMVAADSYYLSLGDEALWYSGDWLDNGWFPTKAELTKTVDQATIQAKYYNAQSASWTNLAKEVKIQVGDEEMVASSSGQLSISLASFESGLYPVFVKRQVIAETGYIRSEKVNLTVGQAPQEHQVGLKVEIEEVQAPAGGKQESISFSITPDLLDFGKLKAGESSALNLNFVNGEAAIYLQSEVTGDDVFRNNIEIDNQFWQLFSAEVTQAQQKVFQVKLAVPLNYSGDLGIKEGGLTFWAFKR